MNMVRASVTLLVLLGAALINFAGCTADDPPDDEATGGAGGGSSSGMSTTCGDGKLDASETCDDGNNSDLDGCTDCAVDECYTCTNEAGQLSTCGLAAAATACQDTKVCNATGKCVDCVDDTQCNGGYCNQELCAKCDDGMKNGDETDQDCGGMHCGKCANAKACSIAGDCTSTFCVDGVCCGDACDGACQSCNIAGSEGSCDLIPKYSEDTSYGMGESCLAADGEACNGGGTCAKAYGQMCSGPAQCASTKCADPTGGMNKVCLKDIGEACTANEECFSKMCDTGATMKCL